MVRLALVMLALVLGGCSRSGDDPPRRTDPDQTRIVVLSPALAVTVQDMGLADLVVGRHAYDMVLDPSVPVCGEQGSINYEALVRARPTHVLIEWGKRELPGRLLGLAQQHGWVVRDFETLRLADVDGAIGVIAGLFPQAETGGKVAAFRELASREVGEPRWAGRVLLVMGSTGQITALGPGSAHHELLVRAGGVPAIDEGSPYMPMHAEDVVRLAPDAVLVIETSPAGGRMGAFEGLGVPAVKAGRVAVIEDRLALLPSTRLVAIAERMEQALERWAAE